MRLLATLMLAFAGSAMAADATNNLADLPFEDLLDIEVSSASKYVQNSQLAPAAVQVIEAEEIRRYGWRTLAEALNSLPGVYSTSNRAYEFIGARGFLIPGDYNTRFLLLLDGQRLNDNIFEQANFGHEFQIDMALVERIEYIPGPGSAIYGSNAVFGVINVITRSAKSLPGGEAALHVTSDGWRTARLTGSRLGDGDKPDIVASFSHGTKSGRDLTYPGAAGLTMADGSASPDGRTHGLDNNTVTRAFGSLTQGGFSASAWAVRREVQPSSALYGSNFDDGRLRLVDDSYGLRAGYRTALNDNLKLESRLAYQKMTYDADYPYYNTTAGAYINRDKSVGSWWSGEVRGLYLGIDRHKLISGIEFSWDQQAFQRNADVAVAINPTLEVNTRSARQGIYLQDEWNFAPAWHLDIGLRHDSFKNGGSGNTSPRLGLIWEASERATFKLLAGNAYRVANAYESAYANNIDTLAAPNLQPEKNQTLEAIGEYRLHGGMKLGASLYNYRMKNLIRQVDVGNGVLQFQNQPVISAQGLELYYQQRRQSGLNVFASLALNHAEDAAGEWLSNSPRWIAKLRASLPLISERLLAALEMNAIGRRTTAWQGTYAELGSQVALNATLTATRLLPGLDIQFRILNLLNRDLRQPASSEAPVPTLPGDGRQWQVGLNYAF